MKTGNCIRKLWSFVQTNKSNTLQHILTPYNCMCRKIENHSPLFRVSEYLWSERLTLSYPGLSDFCLVIPMKHKPQPTCLHPPPAWAVVSWGADSRVVSHSTVVQEVPGSNPCATEKCWAVMELLVNIYLYEFVPSLLCMRVRCFGLYWLSYGIGVNLAPFYGFTYRAA